MDKKHVNKLLNAYMELRAERPDITYPLSFAEHEEALNRTYERLLAGKPEEVIIKFLLTKGGYANKRFQLYEAFADYDMEALNNALYEIAHLQQVGNILSAGTDHTYYSYHIMPELLAANMVDRIPLILPEENGTCHSNVVGTAVVNLFMAIWYENVDYESVARGIAEKKLQTKLTQYDRAYVLYLLALLNKDVDEASHQLEEMCIGHKKSKQFGVNGFDKAFAIGVHGMYNLSFHVYGGALGGKVRMPMADNFCQDLAIWQQRHGNKPGNVSHVYAEPLEIMNSIMKIQPPVMQLRVKSAKEVYLNTDLYAEEVIRLAKG